MGRRRRKRLPEGLFPAEIEALSHDGRGVARVEGKTVFMELALPGEQVLFRYLHRRKSFDEGVAVEVVKASPDRVEPRCPVFGRCGGCALQHMAHGAQLELKERNLLEQLHHFGGVEPEERLEPIIGPIWGYRRSARLGARYVKKRREVLVGFRERWSGFIVDMEECPILAGPFSELIRPLRGLVTGLSIREAVPQIELFKADSAAAMVVRHLEPLSPLDLEALNAFSRDHGVAVYLQPGGPATVAPLDVVATGSSLSYTLPAFGVELRFRPGDFIQVNGEINRRLVERALELLAPERSHRVLDLFCGIGNFSLPLATVAGEVIGCEGSSEMVKRASENASANGLANLRFLAADLTDEATLAGLLTGPVDLVLLDPPRSGAKEVCRALARMEIERICYVSCNPATLARDAGILAEGGFRLLKAGVVDMFPHTAHAEAVALFAR